jgi:hypothetical protein
MSIYFLDNLYLTIVDDVSIRNQRVMLIEMF